MGTHTLKMPPVPAPSPGNDYRQGRAHCEALGLLWPLARQTSGAVFGLRRFLLRCRSDRPFEDVQAADAIEQVDEPAFCRAADTNAWTLRARRGEFGPGSGRRNVGPGSGG